MRQRPTRRWWLAGGLAVAAAATLVTQTADVAAVGGLAGTAAPAPAGAAGRPVEVLLITGARVLTVPAAGGPVSGWVVPGKAGGLAGSVLSLRLGGQAYEIPATAAPYLGRGL